MPAVRRNRLPFRCLEVRVPRRLQMGRVKVDSAALEASSIVTRRRMVRRSPRSPLFPRNSHPLPALLNYLRRPLSLNFLPNPRLLNFLPTPRLLNFLSHQQNGSLALSDRPVLSKNLRRWMSMTRP